MTQPRVMVIVLNYRTPRLSLRAVRAALEDLPPGGEVVLIDNASEDGSGALLEAEIERRGWQGAVRFVQSPRNGGFGAGNNIGLSMRLSDGARPDYFYLLNSDAFPDPGCIAGLVAHLEAHPEAGIVGSHLRGEGGEPHTTAFRFPSAAGELEGGARIGPISRLFDSARVAPELPLRATRVDWVAGASVLMRARMLEEIGLFDEGFFLYFEETDLCRRAARAGWHCWYQPHARAVHLGSVSTGMRHWQRVPAYWFASRARYFRKTHGRPYAALALLARLAGGGLHHLRCALTGRTPEDPPHFLRDLLRTGLGLRPGAAARAPVRPVAEEGP